MAATAVVLLPSAGRKISYHLGKSYMGGLGSMGYVRSFFRDFAFFRVAFYAYDSTVQLEYDSTLSSNVS